MSCQIVFEPSGKKVVAAPGDNIWELALAAKVDIATICGGVGDCGKCKVLVEHGRENLDSYSPAEREHLSPEERNAGYRLACAIVIPQTAKSMVIRVPPQSEVSGQRLQVESLEVPLLPEPVVEKYVVELTAATLEDSRSQEDRLLHRLGQLFGLANLSLTYEAMLELAACWEQGKRLVTCVVWDDRQVIAIEPGDTKEHCYGIAVDMGTTKLAGFLMELGSGEVKAVSSALNPQISYGEDVMSRISFSMGGADKLAALQRAAIEGINLLIEDCCSKAGIKSQNIYEGCFVGNTCMAHLLLGISPRSLGFSPYSPVVSRGVELGVEKLNSRLMTHAAARIYVLPSIAGFVGSDNVAAQLAVNSAEPESDKLRVILDIGTNTEIVLGNKDDLMVCSCASGPAFEGMHIKHGQRAGVGAIEKVRIDQTLEVSFDTIEGAKPVGICGSGLVDAIAEFLRMGIMDSRGKLRAELATKTPRMRRGEQRAWEYVLAWRKESGVDSDIVLTQEDIREVQKAKAAIRAGCEILMKRRGVSALDIDRLVLAGAFGQYLNPQSALAIGMYPDIPLDRIWIVGNAAGAGARMALVSRRARLEAEAISQRVRYHELGADPDFTAEYVRHMLFPASPPKNH